MVTPTTNPYTALIEWIDTVWREPTKADFALVPPRATGEGMSESALRDVCRRLDEVLTEENRANPGEWAECLPETPRSTIPDLTRGRWPNDICTVKTILAFEVTDVDDPTAEPRVYARTAVCTRIAFHTGRHATASGGRITAVWGDRP